MSHSRLGRDLGTQQFQGELNLLSFSCCLNRYKSIQQADYVVPVEIEYHWHNVYVIKRPGVDNFLKKMGEIYEIVVFTASLSKVSHFTRINRSTTSCPSVRGSRPR